ncbi:uncharacterized protein LOC143569216 [Bidens hawaiensis]|uniref:uncharacterized protein LOC143569216 n=1 Tax=Bidens hawaiensis TaxID=980011 RepID=UPI004048F44C
MREISRREGTNRARAEGNASKRRKYLSSNKTSVKTAAQDFLEKATRELLGEDKGSMKGPLKPRDDGDDDDDDMSPDS